jgi:hypothetical protein
VSDFEATLDFASTNYVVLTLFGARVTGDTWRIVFGRDEPARGELVCDLVTDDQHIFVEKAAEATVRRWMLTGVPPEVVVQRVNVLSLPVEDPFPTRLVIEVGFRYLPPAPAQS